MHTTIWYSIASTPWWVYVLLVYCAWISYMATKPRLVSISNLYSLPVFFVSLSIMCMCAMAKTISITEMAVWFGTFTLGVGIGYLQYLVFKIKAFKATKVLYLPGSITPLTLLLLAMVSKYYYGYSLSINPLWLIQPKNMIFILSIYGLLTGLFCGRLSYGLRCMQSGPFLSQDPIETAK